MHEEFMEPGVNPIPGNIFAAMFISLGAVLTAALIAGVVVGIRHFV